MPNPENDADAFFDTLMGRPPPAREATGARALRQALLAQADTLRRAQSATSHDWSAQEAAQMQALKQRLIATGHLGSGQLGSHGGIVRDSALTSLLRACLQRFRLHALSHPVLQSRWLVSGAAAAAVVVLLVSVDVMRTAPTSSVAATSTARPTPVPSAPGEGRRELAANADLTDAALLLSSADITHPQPALAAEQLATRLRALGLNVEVEAVTAPSGSEQYANAVVLAIADANIEQARALALLLQADGITLHGNAPYRILIHR